jgi:2-polyprenyl-3-methyl-5-hydroxy-6-metoxy-1,4-benzoquinol methylase
VNAGLHEAGDSLGGVLIRRLPDGRHKISVAPSSDGRINRCSWITRYPSELIHKILAVKGLFVCHEIMQEEDPRYVEHSIRRRVFTYVEPREFAAKRVLDFGCGAGASTMVLSRLLPPCELVGIEPERKLLDIARSRAQILGCASICFLQAAAGEFDFAMFNGPLELVPMVWAHLKPGGVLFLNKTSRRTVQEILWNLGGSRRAALARPLAPWVEIFKRTVGLAIRKARTGCPL